MSEKKQAGDELYWSNCQFLREKFIDAYENFQTAPQFLTETPVEEFEVPIESKSCWCPIQLSTLEEQFEQQFDKLSEATGAFVWGAMLPGLRKL